MVNAPSRFNHSVSIKPMMAKSTKPGFYAVHRGREPGVYYTWEECQSQVKHFNGAMYKKLVSLEAAEEFVRRGSTKSDSETTISTITSGSRSDTLSRTVNASSASGSSSSRASSSKAPQHEVAKYSGMAPVARNSSGEPTVVQSMDDFDVVYTDGSCHGNGVDNARAGIGVWWGHSDQRNLSERCPGKQTNNRAELIAVVRVLQDTPMSTRPLLIRTDSQYTIKCINIWIHNWKRNGWRTAGGKAVENAAVIRYLSSLLQGRITYGHPVRLEYVKGHAGHEGNEQADQLANMGATMSPMEERNWDVLQQEFEDLMERKTQERNAANGALVSPSMKGPLSQAELEAYAACLLSDEELNDYVNCLLDDDDVAREVAEAEAS
ncbi:hypothetical protein HGRIS_008519 [Hohenbuehelia grisea]|uniref:ribonuclease H n=1 Tax=Hohenbuehelia grisea TaxID=104357 RepID=A0ABR3J872_9AGAR